MYFHSFSSSEYPTKPRHPKGAGASFFSIFSCLFEELFFPVQGLQGSCAFLARYAGKIAFLELPMQPSAGIVRVPGTVCVFGTSYAGIVRVPGTVCW